MDRLWTPPCQSSCAPLPWAFVSPRARNLSLFTLLLIALALRLTWALMQPPAIDPNLPDQGEYLELAQNFLAGKGLAFTDLRFGQTVYAYRAPGYPLFLAGCFASPTVARVVQALLDASTVLGVFLLGRRWLGDGPSLLGALLAAFNPFLIYFSGLLLSETLFTCLLVWGMVLLAWRPNVVWGGMVLALAVLVRPAAAALPVLLGLLAAFLNYHPGELVRPSFARLGTGATMLLLVLVALFPWALRNRLVLDHWVWLSTNGGITKYDGWNPDATGASNQDFLKSPAMAHVARLQEIERDRYFSDLADRYVAETWKNRPLHLLRLIGWKAARTWSPLPLSDNFGRPLYQAIALIYTIPFDLLIVLAVGLARLGRWGKVFLLAPAIYFTLLHALSVGSLRYRIPAEPALAVLAGAGAAVLAQALFRRLRPRPPEGLQP